jgi:hypothetical protein
MHAFLWSVLSKGSDVPRVRQHASGYLIVVPIALDDTSARAPQLVRNSPADVVKIPETYMYKKVTKELANVESIGELQKSSLQPIDGGVSKQIELLDYDAMMQAALSMGHEPEKRQLPGADKQLTGAQKFAEAIDHAKRGDCRSEHAHLGILAIPFLVRDTITGEGCE